MSSLVGFPPSGHPPVIPLLRQAQRRGIHVKESRHLGASRARVTQVASQSNATSATGASEWVAMKNA